MPIKIIELPISPPQSPVTTPVRTPQHRKWRILPLAVEVLAAATTSALTTSKLLRKERALVLIAACLSNQAASAAYRIKPTGHAQIAGVLGVIGAIALTGGETLANAATAGLLVVALLEELAPAQESLNWKQTAAVCAQVALGIYASSVGVGLIQQQMDGDALITGMVVGYGISKMVLKINN